MPLFSRLRPVLVNSAAVGVGLYTAKLVHDSDQHDPVARVNADVQSLVRVGRLVSTVASIVMEYKVFHPLGRLVEAEDDNDVVLNAKVKLLRTHQDEEERLGREVIRLTAAGQDHAQVQNELVASHKLVVQTAEELTLLKQDVQSRSEQVHRVCAEKLLELCRKNGGVYVKLGQHVSQLDYLLPKSYTDTLQSLLENAPTSPFEDVRAVIKQDLGALPEDLWDWFDPIPIASASLGQVHVACDKYSKAKVAVKVQHRELIAHVDGDIRACKAIMSVLSTCFPVFGKRFQWLVDEVVPVVRTELDFENEARNCTRTRELFRGNPQVVVPFVYPSLSSSRVLTMSFEEGCPATDVKTLRKNRLALSDVSRLICDTFNEMVFRHGFVHCDPHPANVRIAPMREGNWLTRLVTKDRPKVVLLDHGQYRELDDDFRLEYARLWQAMVLGNKDAIRRHCINLGAPEDGFPLLSAMITNRPWLEIAHDKGKKGGLQVVKRGLSEADQTRIRTYAEKYALQISEMLGEVPPQMILVFKMNDSLRFIDRALGSPLNTFILAGRASTRVLLDESRDNVRWTSPSSWVTHLGTMFSAYMTDFRLQIAEWLL